MNRSLLYPRATTTRRLIGLDGMWRFSFDPESKGVEAGWALELPSSLSMPVPASFCDLFTDKASREYCGDFWYETSFFVPAEWSGWDIVLRFGSVTHRARVFVNGVEVAQHEGGFLPFDATVTNIVRYNQFNKLSVLANNELSETMLPAGTTRTLADGRKIAAPYFDFYNYAGIHRPVWLMALPKERVLDYSTRYRLTETGAEIDYTVSTNGPHPVTVELYDGTTRVAESSGTTGTLVVKNAKLWNVHAAYLYDLVIRIHEGSAVVDLTEGAYDSLYDNYQDITFTALVPETEEGPVTFFDQAVFIGDSISMTLEAYCGASGALGGAKFLCAGSMSPTNMLTGKILPEYPKGSGQKPAIGDSVAATGAKVVYVMLGMDNIAYGVERATKDYLTILNQIIEKNPGVQIVVQSVTPMADSSTSYSEKLNNEQINAFNETMKAYCQDNRWYYVNVAEAFKDEKGFLKKEYCSDYGSMGMHFTYEGAKIWVQYLKTHIPQDLL